MLYSANIDDLAKPVKDEEETLVDSPPKKRKTTKPKRVAPKEATFNVTDQKMLDVMTANVGSTKGLKGQKATGKRVVKKVLETIEESTPEPEEPVEDVKKKRSKPVKEEIPEPIELPTSEEPPLKKAKTDDEPPAWFHKYVEGVKKEENTLKVKKSSKKVVKKDAKETASKKWSEPHTRGRVEHEVNNHMSRMYSTMFGRQLR